MYSTKHLLQRPLTHTEARIKGQLSLSLPTARTLHAHTSAPIRQKYACAHVVAPAPRHTT